MLKQHGLDALRRRQLVSPVDAVDGVVVHVLQGQRGGGGHDVGRHSVVGVGGVGGVQGTAQWSTNPVLPASAGNYGRCRRW